MAFRTILVLLNAVSILGLQLKEGNECTPLMSDMKIHLGSNVLAKHFITAVEGTGDCGNPLSFRDEKGLTCSQFSLKKGKSKDSIFKIVSEKGGPILSGDMVKLVLNTNNSQMHLQFSRTWPFPLLTETNSNHFSFEITHARPVHILPEFILAQQNAKVHEDIHAGKPICNGDDIFLRVLDTYNGPVWSGFGHLYLQGDEDGLVNFPHHFPGHKGDPQAVRDPTKWVADDSTASANRFMIVAE